MVDEIYDHGPILAQAKVKVEPFDTPETLAEKIHKQEQILYPMVVKKICSGEINLDANLKSVRHEVTEKK